MNAKGLVGKKSLVQLTGIDQNKIFYIPEYSTAVQTSTHLHQLYAFPANIDSIKEVFTYLVTLHENVDEMVFTFIENLNFSEIDKDDLSDYYDLLIEQSILDSQGFN